MLKIGSIILLLAGLGFGIFNTGINTSCSDCTGGVFQNLKIGGGGKATGGSIAADGTQVVRTDSAGAFTRQAPGAVWNQVVTVSSMPSIPAGSTRAGICEIVFAPSNTSHFYMLFSFNTGGANASHVYSSTNKGASWTEVGAATFTGVCGGNDVARSNGPFLAVDPADENTVYLGDLSNGAYYSTNGGSTWTHISTGTIPVPTSLSGVEVGFAPSGSSHTVFIGSWGNGVWKCTSANTTPSCSELTSTGMPTKPNQVIVDASNTVWIIDGAPNGTGSAGNGWQCGSSCQGGSAWHEVDSTGNVGGLAINPSNSNVAYLMHYNDGTLYYAANAQTEPPTFNSFTSSSNKSPLIPWIVNSGLGYGGQYTAASWMAFDSHDSLLYIYTGIGVAKTAPITTNVAFQWDFSETAGIENLTSGAFIPLNGGGVIYSAWDLPIWFPSNPNTTYAAQNYGNNGSTITDPNPGLCTDGGALGSGTFLAMTGSGFTYSSGGSAWSAFTALPTRNGPGYCVIQSSTNWVVADNGGNLYYTTNSGGIWTACTVTGATATGGGWLSLSMDNANNIMVYNNGQGSQGSGAQGFYTSNTGTSGCSFTKTTGQIGVSGTNYGIAAVPGKTCNFFIFHIWDAHNSSPPNTSDPPTFTTNCAASALSTLSSSLNNVFTLGFGAPLASSDGYPTLYAVGWYNSGSGNVPGIWQIKNADSSPTFTNIEVSSNGIYPAGNFDVIFEVGGDLVTPGKVYIELSGSSLMYRTAN